MATNDLSKLSDEELERKAREWKPKQLTKPVKQDLSKLSDEELKKYSAEYKQKKNKNSSDSEPSIFDNELVRQVGRTGRIAASAAGHILDTLPNLAKLGLQGVAKIDDTIRDVEHTIGKNLPIVKNFVPSERVKTPSVLDYWPDSNLGHLTMDAIDYVTNNKLKARDSIEEVIDRAVPSFMSIVGPGAAATKIGQVSPALGKMTNFISVKPTTQNWAGVAGGIGGLETYLHDNPNPGQLGAFGSSLLGSAIASNPKGAFLASKNVANKLLNPVESGSNLKRSVVNSDIYQHARQKTEDFIAKHYGAKMGINEDQVQTLNAWGIPISMPMVSENKQYATSMVDNALRTERGSQPIKNYFQDVEDIGATHFIGNPDRSRNPLYASDIPLAAEQATSNLRAEYNKKIAPAKDLLNKFKSEGVSHKGRLNEDLFDYFGDKVDFANPKNTSQEYKLMRQNPIYKQIDRVKQSENKLLFKKLEQDKSGVASLVYDIQKIPNEQRRLKARESLIAKVGKEKVDAAENLIKNYEGKAQIGVIESAMENLAMLAKDKNLTPTERAQASRTRKNLKDMIDEQGEIYNPEQNKILKDAKKFYMEENTEQLSDGSYQTYSNKPGLIKRSEKFWDVDKPFTTLMSNLDDNLPVIIKSNNKELNKKIAQDIFTELGWRGGQFSLTKLAASMNELTPTVKENLLKMQNFTSDQQKNFYKLMDIMSENAETLRLVANASGSGHKVQANLTKLDKLKGLQKGVNAMNNQDYFKTASYILSPFILPYYNKKMAELMVNPSYVNNVRRVIKNTTDLKKHPSKIPSETDLRNLKNLSENSVSKELLKMTEN